MNDPLSPLHPLDEGQEGSYRELKNSKKRFVGFLIPLVLSVL